MLTLYISEALAQTNALVFSVSNPVPISFPDLTYSDSLSVRLVIVDGAGAVSDASGDAGSTVTVSIGGGALDDGAVWSTSSWTIDTDDPKGWIGELNPIGDDLLALFDGRSEMFAVIQIRVTDADSHVQTYLTMPVKIIMSMNPAGTVASIRDGEATINNGVDFITVSGLNLSAVPRRVMINIQKPDGGGNIFGTVQTSSITADGFTVDLSGVTDMDGYKLEYQLIFG